MNIDITIMMANTECQEFIGLDDSPRDNKDEVSPT